MNRQKGCQIGRELKRKKVEFDDSSWIEKKHTSFYLFFLWPIFMSFSVGTLHFGFQQLTNFNTEINNGSTEQLNLAVSRVSFNIESQ